MGDEGELRRAGSQSPITKEEHCIASNHLYPHFSLALCDCGRHLGGAARPPSDHRQARGEPPCLRAHLLLEA